MIHDRVRGWLRADSCRAESPSQAVIDSQSVQSATMVSEAVGYDGGKQIKGRKRHLTVNTLGLVLRVLVSAANASEKSQAKAMLKRVEQMGEQVKRLYLVWADGGYGREPFLRWVMDTLGWILGGAPRVMMDLLG